MIKIEINEFNKDSNTQEGRGIVLTSHQCRFVLLNLGDVLRYFFQTDCSVLLAIYWECPR